MWTKGGEEEGERGRGSLCLEETLLAPFPRPFRRPFWRSPGAFLGPLSSPFGSLCQRTSCGKERAPDHDHGKRRGRLTTCESSHSSVWYSLPFLLYVDFVRARAQPRRVTYSAHHSFRTHHTALDLGRLLNVQLCRGFVLIIESVKVGGEAVSMTAANCVSRECFGKRPAVTPFWIIAWMRG